MYYNENDTKCPRKMRFSFNTSEKKIFYTYWTRKCSLKEKINDRIQKKKKNNANNNNKISGLQQHHLACYRDCETRPLSWGKDLQAWYAIMDLRCENNFVFKNESKKRNFLKRGKVFGFQTSNPDKRWSNQVCLADRDTGISLFMCFSWIYKCEFNKHTYPMQAAELNFNE